RLECGGVEDNFGLELSQFLGMPVKFGEVTKDAMNIPGEIRSVLAAMKDGQFMVRCRKFAHDIRAQKSRSTQDEDAHTALLPRVHRTSRFAPLATKYRLRIVTRELIADGSEVLRWRADECERLAVRMREGQFLRMKGQPNDQWPLGLVGFGAIIAFELAETDF